MKSLLRSWKKPHAFLFLAAVLLIIASFFSEASIDIHLHDTYFIIANRHLYWAIALLLLILALLYRALRNILFSKILTWLHIIVTLAGFLAALMPVHYQGFAGSPRRYYDYSAWESYKQFGQLNQFVSVAVVLFFFAQFLFPLHILLGLFRWFSRRR
jgi:cytochrome c oxidase subunit I